MHLRHTTVILWLVVGIMTRTLRAFADSAESERSRPPNVSKDPAKKATPRSARKDTGDTAIEIPVYIPPKRGAPNMRHGGATRAAIAENPLRITAVVPERGGLSLLEQPTLYWHLSERTENTIQITVVDQTSVEPLVEAALEGPFEVGIHRISLADYGVHLKPDSNYQWVVALSVRASRETDSAMAGAGIERVRPSSVLRKKLAAAPNERIAFVLAGAGIWYDALDALSKLIDASPADSALIEQRSALLEQVGLGDLAQQESSARAIPHD